ncbi:MAG: amino acid adenylation domain-containing protein, partial [Chloroflexi bacterium]|nr:amino acid adenylation domain-containing protein [Chloroflexota bacterium]
AYPRDLCIHQVFEQQAARTPDAEAVVYEGETLTYGELNRRANQLAHYLRRLGVGRETLVGISVERSLEMMVGLLGILKAGGAYVPLDPDYPAERLAYMLQDAGVALVVTQERIAPRLGEAVRAVCLDRDWPDMEQEPGTNPPHLATPDNLAYVIYTSGSTGRPKGVMVSHRSVVNHNVAVAAKFALKAGDRMLQFASINFDGAVEEIFPTWLAGATLVLRPGGVLPGPSELMDLIATERLTVLDLPTAYWHQWVHDLSLEPGAALPEPLRLVAVGGEKAQRESLIAWQQLPGRAVPWLNTYGPTEATVIATLYDVRLEQWDADRELPIGRPIANMRVYILDDRLQPVPVGVPGELYIGGVGVARGYLHRPDLTAERFVPDPFSGEAGARLYRTGDRARYLADGNIEFLGRLDDQVKVRGFRVELGEIEAALREQPGIKDAVVLAREDTPGQPRLVAYLVPKGQPPAISELREQLGHKLPEYMIPSAYVFLEAFPLTPNAKVDRKALPAPEGRAEVEAAAYVAPRTPQEEMLAGLWAQVLGVEQVGVYDNFFDLGGHSLLATQLMGRIRQTMQVDLPLRTLFEAPTVAALAQRLDGATRRALTPIQPAPRDGQAALSYAQQRLWFLDQLEPGSAMYNIPTAVRLRGALDVAALERSLNEIVRRHEVLRATFQTIEGKPVQRIAPALSLPLLVQDLSALPEQEREAHVRQVIADEAQRPFDLGVGPLLRARLLRVGDAEHIAVLVMHHIISDGWSTNVLVRELVTLYRAFVAGQPSPLPELPIQYADYAAWQREWLQGEVLAEQLDYWKRQLADLPPMLELPTDHPRSPMQTYHGTYQTFELPADVSAAFGRLCQQEGVTPFMGLLAAFQAFLSRYSGQDDIAVGTPIANRTRPESEPLIGFFVNTLVMRGDLSGNPSFRELLQRTREAALGAYAHQDVPFEMVVDAVQPQRDMSHSPLFQAMLVVENASNRAIRMPGLTLEALEADPGTAKFDITLTVAQEPDGLRGAWEYNTDLFEAATVERMARQFGQLLAGLVAAPDRAVDAVPLLTAAERAEIVAAWNDTAADYPADCCASELFEQQVARTPDAVAVVYGEETLTYAALNRRANQLARYLRKRGVGPEVLVGLCVERAPEALVGMLAVLKVGGAYLPLDPGYPPERLAYMLADARVPVLLTQARLMERLPQFGGETLRLDADWPMIAQEAEENLPSVADPDNLAYVIYTSGSTGRPKGVMITRSGLSNYLDWVRRAYPLEQGVGAPVHSSLAFD